MVKKLTNNEDIIDIPADEIEDISNLEHDIQDQMNSIFMEVGQDSRDEQFQIRVYKVIEKTGERGACFSALPSEMPGFIERIQQGFGAGIYEIWIYKNKRIFKRFKQPVLEPRKIETPVQDMRQDLSSVMRTVVESNKQQFAQLKELMLLQGNQQVAPPTPQINMMEMMQGMVGMMSAVQGMMPKPESTNQFEMFLKAADFVKSIGGENGGNGGESNGWDGAMKFIDKFGPGLVEMTGKISEAKANQAAQIPQIPQPQGPRPQGPQPQGPQPQGPQAQPRVNPAPRPEAVPDSTQTKENDMKLMQQMALKRYVETLCQKAHSGSDPVLYAELIIDNMEEFPPDAVDALLYGDPVQLLGNMNPIVLSHAEWFTKLVEHIRSVILEPEAQEVDDPLTENTTKSDNVAYNETPDIPDFLKEDIPSEVSNPAIDETSTTPNT